MPASKVIAVVPSGPRIGGSRHGALLLNEGHRLDDVVFEYVGFFSPGLEATIDRVNALVERHSASRVYIMLPARADGHVTQFARDLAKSLKTRDVTILTSEGNELA